MPSFCITFLETSRKLLRVTRRNRQTNTKDYLSVIPSSLPPHYFFLWGLVAPHRSCCRPCALQPRSSCAHHLYLVSKSCKDGRRCYAEGFRALELRINISFAAAGVGYAPAFSRLPRRRLLVIYHGCREGSPEVSQPVREKSAQTQAIRRRQGFSAAVFDSAGVKSEAGSPVGLSDPPAALLPSSLPDQSGGGGRSAPRRISSPPFTHYLLN